MRYFTTILLLVVFGGSVMLVAEGQPTVTKPPLEPIKVRVQPTKLPAPKKLSLTAETYPRTSGSTSAEPMGVWVACRLLNQECGWPPMARE